MSSKKLEIIEDGLPVEESDLNEGNKVIWLPQQGKNLLK